MTFTKMRTAADLFATFLVTIAAVFFLWTQFEARFLRPTQDQKPQNVSGLTIAGDKVRHARGTGTVALVEFTDYECPYCGHYARNTAPDVDKEFVATGKLRYVVFNFPLELIHPRAKKAGEAAECAARQGHFWEMRERLFSVQADLGAIPQLVRPLSLDYETFTRCLQGESTEQIAADLAEGRRLGVTSTPTFFFGHVQGDGSIQLAKRISGAVPIEMLRETISSIIGNGQPKDWRSLFSMYSSNDLAVARRRMDSERWASAVQVGSLATQGATLLAGPR
jgi:protein-disulfide isomerase